jgi:hypothetical protein
MNDLKTGHFPPARQLGLIVHGVIILLLASASIWGFTNLTNAQVGPTFVSYLLVGLIAFAPIPYLGYRAYALVKADYYIDRDSLAILWGLRIEDIPLTDIEWVRPASDLTTPLSLPRFRMPGAVLGRRRHSDLGAVEFIASSTRNLILIATPRHVFAISPRDAVSLVRTFARATELGSLTPTEAKSVYPPRHHRPESPYVSWTSGLLFNLAVAWLGPDLASQVPFGFNLCVPTLLLLRR